MSLELLAPWVVVGLLVGCLGGVVMKVGGYGLTWDLVLGLAGSAIVSGSFWILGASPDTGTVVMTIVAFVGAAVAIVAQRTMYAHA